MSNFQNLDAWKISMELVKMVYQLTKKYPKEEIYGLVSQTRRAAVSIPSKYCRRNGQAI
jgi:four helix bundle protein